MITPKIKALFQFIEYLHSNIDNFKQYDEVLNELRLLDKERQKVGLKKNFKDKLKYDEVQEQIKDRLNIIQENILQPIKAKATELSICELNETETLWNWNISEISELKENFSKDDLPEIFSHKNKYLEYRTETNGEAFLGLSFFFDDLDQVLKTLFDFFKETDQNEFEAFETKAIQVNGIIEAVQLFQSGKFSKFTLSNSFLNPSTIQQQPNNEDLPLQPIESAKETNESPKTFEELFYNTDLVEPSIDILKELDPPLIDTDCNYIGKLKGIVCVWIDELQRQGIVKHYSDRKIFASLIPQKIKRFSIDESMFGKYQTRAESNYRTDIKAKVSKIKLSQNSH